MSNFAVFGMTEIKAKQLCETETYCDYSWKEIMESSKKMQLSKKYSTKELCQDWINRIKQSGVEYRDLHIKQYYRDDEISTKTKPYSMVWKRV